MINTILHYLLFASPTLFWGIGFERVFLKPENPEIIFLNFFKSALSSLGTVLVVYFLTRLLVPYGMAELMPVIAVLVFILLMVLMEAVITVITRKSAPEFIVPFLCVLMALCESGNLSGTVGIAFSSLLSYYACVQLLYRIKKRLEISVPKSSFAENALMIVSSAVVMLILCSLGASWVFGGGMK